jgi:hypothetical protein
MVNLAKRADPLRVRVPASFSCMDNARDENDNVPAILFWCNRLRLYKVSGWGKREACEPGLVPR